MTKKVCVIPGDDASPEAVLNGVGLANTGSVLGDVFQVRAGVRYDHSGQYAAFGPFAYASS